MGYTYTEIKYQYDALEKTYDKMCASREDILRLTQDEAHRKIIFIGCGSGYSLCKSADLVTALHTGRTAYAFPAGDILLHHRDYRQLISDALVVTFSRSGETSEVVRSLQILRTEYGCKSLAIVCAENSAMEKAADASILLPWAFDHSVCQTRTVSNLYAAILLFGAIVGADAKLLTDVRTAIDLGRGFLQTYEPDFKELGSSDFRDVVILADGELRGLADEGSLAFCEICQIPGKHYHTLDVRHGPTVMIDRNTLVISVGASGPMELYGDLLGEIAGYTQRIVTICPGSVDSQTLPGLHIPYPDGLSQAVYGLPLIGACQMISYYKAIARQMDPDKPGGLRPWITLS